MRLDPPRRLLVWEGCLNVRDLGGHETVDGRVTRFGAVVRSDSPDGLTEAGWAAAHAHGIRTIVDLRTHGERPARSPAGLETVHLPVFDFEDTEFWGHRDGVWDSVGYRNALARWPEQFAAAVAAVGRAAQGGVLVHCQVGRDRTGLVCALLLSLAGVPAEAIAADYALSEECLHPLYARLIEEAEDDVRRAQLGRERLADAAVMLGLLESLDVEGYLREAGLSTADVAAVRRRLLGN
jgi:protein-tyrosine phosphatase